MKKYQYLTIIVLVCIVLAGCSRLLKVARQNIAEVRQNIYIGENENVVVSFMAGKREEEYVINGVCTPLTQFGVIAVTLQNTNIGYVKSGAYSLTNESKSFSGTLVLNPFDNTYVADIGTIIDNDSPINLDITIGSFTTSVTLNKINSQWKIDHNKALEISTKALKPQLKGWAKKGFDGEVYIKIIHDSKISSTDYFWYVCFVNTSGTSHSVIIDPMTSEILAKK